MRTGRKVLLIVGIIIVALVGIMAIGAFSGMRYVRTMEVSRVDLSGIADGVYHGSFARGRFSHSVEVSVKDHRIVSAKSTGPSLPTDAIIGQILDRVVQEQSARVETVSGASLTTKAVTKAVENALGTAK